MYLAKLAGSSDTLLADKAFTIIKNQDEATRCLQTQLQEFSIGRDLKHPNIIKYLYFMRHLNKRSDKHHFHLLMEYVDGADLRTIMRSKSSY